MSELSERLHLRRARREDVPAIVRLFADDEKFLGGDKALDPLPREYWDAFDRIEAQPGNRFLVGEIDGEVVACVQLTVIHGLARHGASRGTIENVHVLSRLRGRGLGGRMMRHVIEEARADGCRIVQLTSRAHRADAHRFYARLGFEATHLGFKLML